MDWFLYNNGPVMKELMIDVKSLVAAGINMKRVIAIKELVF